MSQQEKLDFLRNFSETLKAVRSRRGWNQEDLAQHLGVPVSNVAAWETMAHGTTRKRMAEIAAKLGFSAEYMMTGRPPDQEPIVLRDAPDPAAPPTEISIRFTTHERKAAECVNHLVNYLNQIGADADQLSWLLVELRKRFPAGTPAPARMPAPTIHGANSKVTEKLRALGPTAVSRARTGAEESLPKLPTDEPSDDKSEP